MQVHLTGHRWINEDVLEILYESEPYGFSIKEDASKFNSIIATVMSLKLRKYGLEEGMTIRSVNSKNCLGRTHKRVARMIQEAGFPLKLRFSKLYVHVCIFNK